LGGFPREAFMATAEELRQRLHLQETKHTADVQRLNAQIQELRRLVKELEEQDAGNVGRLQSSDSFTRRVEWTIPDFKKEERSTVRGQPLWSPRFSIAGVNNVRLEFLPKGRDKSYEGFCSLFLWCPAGVKIRYQLWVGSFLKAPDLDEYKGEIGHGHSNFCPLEPEIDRKADSITVGVDIIEVIISHELTEKGLTLTSWPLQRLVAKEAEVLENRGVNQVIWKINKISECMKNYPRGSSMCSKSFTAGGISEILMEFYPNGSQITKKDGHCSFYLRCPDGVSMIVTLIVGKTRKGPIKTTFDTASGKGLPDFCPVKDEINWDDDSIEVGIELQNRPSKVLTLTS